MPVYSCFPQIDEFQNFNRVYFQQVGTPHCVRDALNENFPNRWFVRGKPIAWPPRRPICGLCDLFLWGCLKNLVYSKQIQSVAHLKCRIRFAMSTVTRDMLSIVWDDTNHRLDVCRVSNGGHIEIY